jgi:rubrerythrin
MKGAEEQGGCMKGKIFVIFAASVFMLFCAVSAHAEDAPLKVGTTLENLMAAYNGEVNANARYLAFAQKANEEGYDIAASLFRAAAYAEQVHFERHAELIKELGGTPTANLETPVVSSTTDNVESAYRAEKYESEIMYPAFAAQAKKENIQDAAISFQGTAAAEKSHAGAYERMTKNLTISRGLRKDFFVCPVCGYITDAITTRFCPICSTDTRKFKRIN